MADTWHSVANGMGYLIIIGRNCFTQSLAFDVTTPLTIVILRGGLTKCLVFPRAPGVANGRQVAFSGKLNGLSITIMRRSCFTETFFPLGV